jgi:hypothetical protein
MNEQEQIEEENFKLRDGSTAHGCSKWSHASPISIVSLRHAPADEAS